MNDTDLETIFHAEGSATAEIEALTLKELLESNGIMTILVGDSVLPNLPFEIKVPRDQAERARHLIAEAERPHVDEDATAELEFDRDEGER